MVARGKGIPVIVRVGPLGAFKPLTPRCGGGSVVQSFKDIAFQVLIETHVGWVVANKWERTAEANLTQ